MEEINQEPEEFCPYVGLQPYSEADHDYFFGRERDSRIISSNLYAAALTVLYGASGVGKSSVLWAGVLPHLQTSRRTAVMIFDGWADHNLLQTLKTRCLQAIVDASGGKEFQLDLDLPLDELLFQATEASGCTLLIILDQFEEYFLYHPDSEDQFDIEFASAINREDVDANFMVAMREDALSRLDRFRARIPNMLGNSLRLRHLDAPSARDAMRKPLEVYALQYPDQPLMSIEEALVEQLIEDIQVEKLMIGGGGQGVVERTDGAEGGVRIEAPFLQLVLTRLWNEELSQGSQVLRLETLEALGGAARLIRTHMDSAMNALTPEEQETVAGLFRYMVTPSGTKIAYTVADLEYYANTTRAIEPMLQKLAQGKVRILRPVTTPGEPGVIRYQIYHDVLAPAVLDWRARFENSKQQLNLFNLLIEKGDMENAFQVYQDIVQRTPQQAFFPERYEARKIMGKGELGVTYALFDREENQFVAATLVDQRFVFTPEELDSFAHEIGKLSSPRISHIHGFERHRENTYMLSELVDGSSLRSRLNQGLPLAYQEAMQIARQVIEALEDSHHQGLPHLNLRPSNIMLSEGGVKLVNYGISRLTALHRTGKSARVYMDDYLAPEQLDRQGGDERSDIYALGTIIYEMLIGHPPSVGRFYYPSEVNLEATQAVDILIDHARESKPERRFATVVDMRMEMDRITMASVKKGPTQYLRVALAKVSQIYKKILSSRRDITFLLIGFLVLLALSISLDMPSPVRTPARVLMPILLNSLLVSVLCEWVIGALARRRGLGSLSTSGSGMGAILGAIFTLNLIVVLGVSTLSFSVDFISDYLGLLTFAIFETAFALVIMVASAWISDRLFKSYIAGFYWSFVAIVILEIVLTIMQQPKYLFGG